VVRPDMELVHDGAATEIEQLLALSTGAGTRPLPVTLRRQGVLDRHPLAQLCRPSRVCCPSRRSASRRSSGGRWTLRPGVLVVQRTPSAHPALTAAGPWTVPPGWTGRVTGGAHQLLPRPSAGTDRLGEAVAMAHGPRRAASGPRRVGGRSRTGAAAQRPARAAVPSWRPGSPVGPPDRRRAPRSHGPQPRWPPSPRRHAPARVRVPPLPRGAVDRHPPTLAPVAQVRLRPTDASLAAAPPRRRVGSPLAASAPAGARPWAAAALRRTCPCGAAAASGGPSS
jgi:hypothetical protein